MEMKHICRSRKRVEGNLLSPYAVTKRCDEEWAKQYTMHYGLDTYGMRYFNVFGRRQDPHGAYAAVLPKFIKQLLDNEQPTINGDGKQSRDFTYIDNVIEANLKACLALMKLRVRHSILHMVAVNTLSTSITL